MAEETGWERHGDTGAQRDERWGERRPKEVRRAKEDQIYLRMEGGRHECNLRKGEAHEGRRNTQQTEVEKSAIQKEEEKLIVLEETHGENNLEGKDLEATKKGKQKRKKKKRQAVSSMYVKI